MNSKRLGLTPFFIILTLSIGIVLTSYSPLKANALDLSEFGLGDNFGQSVECVIVVAGCDGTGSVGSSGDTIIGSNNGNGNDEDTGNDNGGGGSTTEPTTGTLNTIKITECNDENSTAPGQICSQIATDNHPQDWTISVFGSDSTAPINTFSGSESGVATTLPEGSYSVEEQYAITDGFPLVSDNDVENVGQFSPGCEGTINSGEEVTCTITNTLVYTSQLATLKVIKIVTCISAGGPGDVECGQIDNNFEPSDFPITVTGPNPNPSTFQGDSSGTDVIIQPGSYSVTEDISAIDDKIVVLDDDGNPIARTIIIVHPGLSSTSEDCSGTIEAGQTKTCTITNGIALVTFNS